MPKELKYTQWCDVYKTNHAFCVDEKQTEEEFVTNNFVSFFLNQRGCSWQVAILHAQTKLKSMER